MLQFKNMTGLLPVNLGYWVIELSENSFVANINIRYTVVIYIRADEKGCLDRRVSCRLPLFEDDPETELSKTVSDTELELIDGIYYRAFYKYPSGDTLEKAFACAEKIVKDTITKLQSIVNENGMVKSGNQNLDISLY